MPTGGDYSGILDNRAYRVLPAALTPLDPPYTLLAWATYDDMLSNRVLISVCDNSKTGNFSVSYIGCRTSGQISATSYDDAGAQNSALWVSSPALGTPFFAAAVFAATNSRSIVVNGDVANKVINTGARVVTGVNQITLGCRVNVSTQFPHDGLFFQAAAVNKALSDAEIVALNKGMSPLEFGNACFMLVDSFGLSPLLDLVAGPFTSGSTPPSPVSNSGMTNLHHDWGV